MWSFFWFTVVGGFLKWIHAVFIKKEVSTIDTIALVYSVVFFIVLLIFQPKDNPIEILVRDPIEIHQNSELKKNQEKDKEWRESLGTGILDSD